MARGNLPIDRTAPGERDTAADDGARAARRTGARPAKRSSSHRPNARLGAYPGWRCGFMGL